ncbi:RsmB/NOP family class I SAM-dependent RNA methyltransferase [Ralstonia mannitolilytica]|uniref:RsmB/NOP family class I SAM-dependent RNA methyltransferase n=1 Tax=Ralstonia mannitolilytica TaxID=105219 RepID=UPI0028F58FF0|nr:RsmB/NOP family class I SAM-dependent RNA methyltransferase [Ralstonia mannitolilytica]CAJ0711621.1 Ribosomal RNA small subunit methyltransferase B [Ralstonia mannitolilytica]
MSQDRQRPRNGGSGSKRSGSGGGGWYRAPQGKPAQRTPRPRTGVHGSHLEHLDKVLARLLHFAAPADMVVSQYFREHHELGHRERGIIAEAAFAVLRRKNEFGQFAESGSGPARRRLALLGLVQTAGRQAIAPFLNPAEAEWLDRWQLRDRAALAPRVRANLPDWLFDALVAQLGAEFTEALAEAWLTPAPLDLRVNTLKGDRDTVLATLAEAGIEGAAAPLSPVGIRLAGKPALNKLEIFTNGTVEVQDEGSQLLCQLLAPKRGEMVVDFCAGAGGKTLAIGAAMRSTGRLYAFDVSEKRLSNLGPRLARSGLSNVHPSRIDSEHDAKVKRLAGKIDRVLVDAPCSGLGTLRRNPDLKWRQSAQAVEEMSAKQRSILDSAARLLKPGGRLVYATCSVLARENQQVVEQFLAAHEDFVLVPAGEVLAAQKIALEMGPYLELYPHVHQTDGFFAAVLERRA